MPVFPEKTASAKTRARLVAGIFFGLLFGLGALHAQYVDFGKKTQQQPLTAEEPEAPPPDFLNRQGAARAPRIGRIVWIDQTGTRAVIWLDRNYALLERPLAVRDNALRPQALLRMTNERTARSLGVVVERGKIFLNQEVVLPGEEMVNLMVAGIAPTTLPLPEPLPKRN